MKNKYYVEVKENEVGEEYTHLFSPSGEEIGSQWGECSLADFSEQIADYESKSSPSAEPDAPTDHVNSATQKARRPETLPTPGPWRYMAGVDGRTHAVAILADWKCDGSEPYHPLIAQALFGRGCAPKEIAEANARLIAAAPDLLETLKWIVEYPQALIGNNGFQKEVNALIAKAEGRQS